MITMLSHAHLTFSRLSSLTASCSLEVGAIPAPREREGGRGEGGRVGGRVGGWEGGWEEEGGRRGEGGGEDSLISRPHPLTRRNGLVNQVEFLGLVHAFATL